MEAVLERKTGTSSRSAGQPVKQFANPAVTGIAPDGYMTSQEFRRRATAKVNNFCKTYGIL